MLIWLFEWLSQYHSGFNVFRYLTLRGICGVLTSITIFFIFGPAMIRKLSEYQIGQTIRMDGPPTHFDKVGTPTMGGLLILSPFAGIVATIVGLSLVGATRYVSLGSVTAAALGSLVLIILAFIGPALGDAPMVSDVPLDYIYYGIIGGTLIVVRHKDNIQRLLKGTERKIGQRAET